VEACERRVKEELRSFLRRPVDHQSEAGFPAIGHRLRDDALPDGAIQLGNVSLATSLFVGVSCTFFSKSYLRLDGIFRILSRLAVRIRLTATYGAAFNPPEWVGETRSKSLTLEDFRPPVKGARLA